MPAPRLRQPMLLASLTLPPPSMGSFGWNPPEADPKTGIWRQVLVYLEMKPSSTGRGVRQWNRGRGRSVLLGPGILCITSFRCDPQSCPPTVMGWGLLLGHSDLVLLAYPLHGLSKLQSREGSPWWLCWTQSHGCWWQGAVGLAHAGMVSTKAIRGG